MPGPPGDDQFILRAAGQDGGFHPWGHPALCFWDDLARSGGDRFHLRTVACAGLSMKSPGLGSILGGEDPHKGSVRVPSLAVHLLEELPHQRRM